jgi:glycogen debranching enzyme
MTDDSHFNWNSTPLTSVSKLDKEFVTTLGTYQGNASWSGNVWTLCNEMVIRGLLDCGEDSLAAELALKSVRAFNHNCAEFINPFDRSGHGVIQYAWTASQYLELLIEVIFGAKYAAGDEFIPTPHLCDELMCECIALENIRFPDGSVKSIFIENGVARVE